MHRFARAAGCTMRSFASSAKRAPSMSGAAKLVGAGVVAAGLWGVSSMVAPDATLCASADENSLPKIERATVSVYDFPIGSDFPNVIPCFIEVAKGSRNKYEWDESVGFLRLDRVLHSAVFYPHNYGFVPQTLCGDGDPLDVLVLGEETIPGAIVDVRPLGYMIMEDEKGLDEKVLAVPVNDPRFDEYRSLRDVPDHLLREISHFFGTYKALEKKKWAKVGGWKGSADTEILLQATHAAYNKAKEDHRSLTRKAAEREVARRAQEDKLAAVDGLPDDAAY